ncbi:fumarate hydratase [Luteirhabdus pelagi]|uniref:fumarate hydratase n=1 Tax=Luteirhabdus pelagi TaxID=2792783 RepID=UPI00193A82B8|nr:fumarate hydratase [Luteirhabdus pelagi]
MYSVISGDIVSSTSLSQKDREKLEYALATVLKELEAEYSTFGRIIKGDYVECVVPDASKGLRVALAIKSYVKTIDIDISEYTDTKSLAKLFKQIGIRLAIGYGELKRFEPEKGIVDGPAIYRSGRAISGKSNHDKERVVIKNTLFFISENEALDATFKAIFELLDVLLNKATARQCEVVFHKLLGKNEDAIASLLGINQSVVNQHSTSVGWNAIETAVNYFESTLKA